MENAWEITGRPGTELTKMNKNTTIKTTDAAVPCINGKMKRNIYTVDNQTTTPSNPQNRCQNRKYTQHIGECWRCNRERESVQSIIEDTTYFT